jgi:WD repeat and SOF domain-containing protein 1
MVKIKTISRTAEDSVRKSKHDITKVHRNRDPALHPFERAREYTKAVVATKLDKMFHKPFIGALDGHNDSVNCCAVVRNKNVPFISGACDGIIKVWDLAHKSCFWTTVAHSGFVRGIAPDAQGTTFYTCGDDKMVKQWALDPQLGQHGDEDDEAGGEGSALPSERVVAPLHTVLSSQTLACIDHHWTDRQFATGGDTVQLWDSTRDAPLHSYKWGADSVVSVKFNPAEACLLGSTDSDRGVCLYDLRASQPMRKFLLPMRSNKLAWNPMEPFNFLLANEDHNVYSFDMRNLEKALMVHKDHVSAVQDVAFSPTGREFCTGGYDRTIRLFKTNRGRSYDMYHLKRMQRIFCVSYSADARFILSGSDDTNVRIWKADADAALGVVAGRKERREQVRETIKKRYQHMPELQRIAKDTNIPKSIKKATAIKHIQTSSSRRKQDNRIRHNDVDTEVVPERTRAVVAQLK